MLCTFVYRQTAIAISQKTAGQNCLETERNAFIYQPCYDGCSNHYNPFFCCVSLHRLFICSVNGAGKHIYLYTADKKYGTHIYYRQRSNHRIVASLNRKNWSKNKLQIARFMTFSNWNSVYSLKYIYWQSCPIWCFNYEF